MQRADGYRSPFADDPALPRAGQRAYRTMLGAFVAFDLLLLGCAIASPSVGPWVSLIVAVAAEAAFLGYVHRPLRRQSYDRGADRRKPR